MPRVVPTQVASYIEGELGGALGQDGYQVDPQFADRLSTIIRLVDEIPSELVAISGATYNTFLGSAETLRTAVELWKGNVRTESYFHSRVGKAVRCLYDTLKVMQDEQVAVGTAELIFIADPKIRDNIRRDISSANQALHEGGWKAATVLGGATVEALLLWAVDQRSASERVTAISAALAGRNLTKAPPKRLEDWVLNDLIEVSAQLGLIKGTTAEQARLAKDFRNLIHPGRSARLAQPCNRGTALTACAALEHVVDDLSP